MKNVVVSQIFFFFFGMLASAQLAHLNFLLNLLVFGFPSGDGDADKDSWSDVRCNSTKAQRTKTIFRVRAFI